MRPASFSQLLLLLVSSTALLGTHAHRDRLHDPIPQVQAEIADLLKKYAGYKAYTEGPTGTVKAAALSIQATATGVPPEVEIPKVDPPVGVKERQVVVKPCASYWMENIKHQGISAFNANPAGYKVFRNVKDFGAVGDGIHDDTDAINTAISSGGRCAPGQCQSSTVTPALVYFPAGTYLIRSSLILYYMTSLHGNPNCPPRIVAKPTFSGFGLVDGNQYQAGGVLGFGATNTFYRQIRNLVFDMTLIPGSAEATGLHWPTAQATSLQNCVFLMSEAAGNKHTGLFIEGGSGGFMGDLIFKGGLQGALLGNQQFTMRNITFTNCQTAIKQIWDWGWTYKSVSIKNCTTGIDMSDGTRTAQNVGSVTLIDSSFQDVQVAVKTNHDLSSLPATAGSLVLENVALTNVGVAVQGANGVTALGGGTTTVSGWVEGHIYTPSGPSNVQQSIASWPRPAALTVSATGKFFEKAKPQYGTNPLASIVSVRSGGAKGDGVTDDTAVLQAIMNANAGTRNIVFFDAGTYKVTNTLFIPPGTTIVGEMFATIMSSGANFADKNNPRVVVKVGNAGQSGKVEWSDMIVSTQGAQAGAILIEWNLSGAAGSNVGGMWDVHTRVGGFKGSNLQVSQCPVHSPAGQVPANCVAAYMLMHITPSGEYLYMENNWLWTADHDLDDPSSTRVTVFTGRGLLIRSTNGRIWLLGTASEHNVLYQYQFANTRTIFAGQIQTETPYYQPVPNALSPFPPVAAYSDPDFATTCAGKTGNCAAAWGLRVLNGIDIGVYGAGLYSFFSDYSTSCSDAGNGATCQNAITSIEGIGRAMKNINIYNLNTVGAISMITRNGVSDAKFSDNVNVYPYTVAVWRIP